MTSSIQQLLDGGKHLLFAQPLVGVNAPRMALGKRIAEVRAALDMKQETLCARVNELTRPGEKELTQPALSALERRDSVSSEFAIRIADALNVSVRWLLDGQGDRNARDWPFPDLPIRRFTSLTPNQRIEIQGLVRAKIAEFEAENAAKAVLQ